MRGKRRILILDDEPIVCERLKPALEKSGFEVETYTDSQKVIDRLMEEKFDVLVTDLKMQGPDGIDVLRFAQEHAPATKVIIITGFATVDTAREAMRRDERAAQDASFIAGLLYPDKHLQERLYTILPFLAKHGPGLIDTIHDGIELDCPDHQVLVV